MEENQKKNMCVCVCVTESLCCTPETNTTLQINCTSMENNFFKKRMKF